MITQQSQEKLLEPLVEQKELADPQELISRLTPERVRVLMALADGPAAQKDIAPSLDKMLTVYHHVAVLFGMGWIFKIKYGASEVLYEINPVAIDAVIEFLESLRG